MIVLASAPAFAKTFNTEQKTEIEAIIKEYVFENPQIIIDALENMQKKMMEERKEKAKKALKENRKEVEAGNTFIGNKNGKIVIIEFFDYNCGYCRSMSETFRKKIDEHKDLKIVMKELPSLSADSAEASKIAIAASMQGKYSEINKELMNFQGQNNKETAMNIAEKLGLDMKKLAKDAESDEVKKILENNRELATTLGSQAVPTIIIGEEVVMGAITETQLDEYIANLEKSKK